MSDWEHRIWLHSHAAYMMGERKNDLKWTMSVRKDGRENLDAGAQQSILASIESVENVL